MASQLHTMATMAYHQLPGDVPQRRGHHGISGAEGDLPRDGTSRAALDPKHRLHRILGRQRGMKGNPLRQPTRMMRFLHDEFLSKKLMVVSMWEPGNSSIP